MTLIGRILAKLRGDLPRQCIEDSYLILLKSARRCAYDLSHAGSDLSLLPDDGLERPDYYERAHYWLKLFAPDGIKNYRHEMHLEIWRLEQQVKDLEKQLRAKGFEPDADWGA
jgi:hypothetical protein